MAGPERLPRMKRGSSGRPGGGIGQDVWSAAPAGFDFIQDRLTLHLDTAGRLPIRAQPRLTLPVFWDRSGPSPRLVVAIHRSWPVLYSFPGRSVQDAAGCVPATANRPPFRTFGVTAGAVPNARPMWKERVSCCMRVPTWRHAHRFQLSISPIWLFCLLQISLITNMSSA